MKIRGVRVEPNEVAVLLSAYPAVSHAVVTARPDEQGEPVLVAFVVASDPASATPAELRSHLEKRLPAAMVPRAFVLVDDVPRTPNGKVDWRALPEPRLDAATAEEWIAPRTSEERRMAELWSAVLARDGIGAGDNFFALGGAVAARHAAGLPYQRRLRRLYSTAVGVRSTGALGACERRRRGTRSRRGPERWAPAGDRPAAAARDRQRRKRIMSDTAEYRLPTSYAQRRLWFLEQLEAGSGAYNVPLAVRLRGALDPSVLDRCLDELRTRHETLRTRFVAVDGEPVQVVMPPTAARRRLPIDDLSGLPAPVREREAEARARAEARDPFILDRGSLLRTRLLHLDERDHILLMTAHHVVIDGWSLDILVRELTALYEAFAAGRPSPLPPLAIQYGDYALWQREHMTDEALADALTYWRGQLADAPPLLGLPTDLPRLEPPLQLRRRDERDAAKRARGADRTPHDRGASLALHDSARHLSGPSRSLRPNRRCHRRRSDRGAHQARNRATHRSIPQHRRPEDEP